MDFSQLIITNSSHITLTNQEPLLNQHTLIFMRRILYSYIFHNFKKIFNRIKLADKTLKRSGIWIGLKNLNSASAMYFFGPPRSLFYY